MESDTPRPPHGNANLGLCVHADNVVWDYDVTTLEHPAVVTVTQEATWIHEGAVVADERNGIVYFHTDEVAAVAAFPRAQLPGREVRRHVTRDLVAVIVDAPSPTAAARPRGRRGDDWDGG